MDLTLLFVALLVIIALVFDFTNGFHDSANSIATVIATETLTPLQAVIMAAFFNFIVVFFITLHVAATIGKGIVIANFITLPIIFGCLMGAITWNIITWYFGLPTSSSHALIGGLIGATLGGVGEQALIMAGILKVVAFIFIAPVIGFTLGVIFNSLLQKMSPKDKHQRWYRILQLFSASLYSMGHGANDAQKTIGIIFLILVAGGLLSPTAAIPLWIVFLSFGALSLGTLFGGMRIVQTLWFKLTKINVRQGFSAESGGSVVLFLASAFGIPVSTTHTITGAIIGAGISEPKQKIKWKKAGEIMLAWVLTIPCAGLLAFVFLMLCNFVIGLV